jgi:hypothetical protein
VEVLEEGQQSLLHLGVAEGQVHRADAEQEGQKLRTFVVFGEAGAIVAEFLFDVEVQPATGVGQVGPVAVQQLPGVYPAQLRRHRADEQQGQVVGGPAVSHHLPVEDGAGAGGVVLAEHQVVAPEVGVGDERHRLLGRQEILDDVFGVGPQLVQAGQHALQAGSSLEELRQLRQTPLDQLLVGVGRAGRLEQEGVALGQRSALFDLDGEGEAVDVGDGVDGGGGLTEGETPREVGAGVARRLDVLQHEDGFGGARFWVAASCRIVGIVALGDGQADLCFGGQVLRFEGLQVGHDLQQNIYSISGNPGPRGVLSGA